MERLKERRKRMRLTQQQVADRLHISRVAYCMYETGQRQPNHETLCKLADFYHVNIEYLLNRTEIPDPFPVITPKELHLIQLYRVVDERGKDFIFDMVKLQANKAVLENKKADDRE